MNEPIVDICFRIIGPTVPLDHGYALGIRGKLGLGRRRVMRIKDKTIVGFQVVVAELTAEESITLQEHGLGGRRRMGCGIFVPLRGRTGP